MHEIGHTLGIAHNGQFIGAGNPTNIPNTPDTVYDPESVFNMGGVTFNRCEWCTVCEFNENDITTIEYLYPPCDECDYGCEIKIELNNAGTDCYLDVISIGCNKPLSFLWTYPFGATTTYFRIGARTPGEYCVEITDVDGCTFSDCITVDANCDEE